jgi:hypothetical protein
MTENRRIQTEHVDRPGIDFESKSIFNLLVIFFTGGGILND